uniref:Uncharacterized protein n=1 Tax=Caenorhabditis japonica TaxID=281687 RepID=A0A8R1IMF2_CAEJA
MHCVRVPILKKTDSSDGCTVVAEGTSRAQWCSEDVEGSWHHITQIDNSVCGNEAKRNETKRHQTEEKREGGF